MKTNLNVDTQGLREKILDLAMRGKLVEQDAGDEPASALLEKIKAEKAELVKEGKIKKSKKLPEITDDEKPFDIPDSWEWVRLGTLFTVNDRNTADDETVAAFVPMSYIEDGYGNNFSFITKQWKEIKSGYTHIRNGEIIIAKITPCFQNRKSFIASDLPNEIGAATTEVYALKQFYSVVKEFFLYFFKSKHFINNGVNNFSGAVGQQRVPRKYLESIVLPLPPLAEQRRIADKVSELFSQIDVIEKNVAEYQDLEQAMRSKLLDLAMRGKLVEQDPNDEPASELLKQIQSEKAQLVKEGKIKKGKKLPEITDDEKPFDIPDSWKWVRLGDIGDWGAGATPLKSNHEYYENGTIPWILTGDLNDGHISSANQFITEKALNETSVKIKPVGSVLIAMYGATIGKLGILDIEATTNQACCACVTFSGISKMYLFDYLMFMKPKFIESGVGGAQPNISRTKIVATPIPLPPLEEQKRIVAKLEELFEQLDIINNNLVSAS